MRTKSSSYSLILWPHTHVCLLIYVVNGWNHGGVMPIVCPSETFEEIIGGN